MVIFSIVGMKTNGSTSTSAAKINLLKTYSSQNATKFMFTIQSVNNRGIFSDKQSQGIAGLRVKTPVTNSPLQFPALSLLKNTYFWWGWCRMLKSGRYSGSRKHTPSGWLLSPVTSVSLQKRAGLLKYRVSFSYSELPSQLQAKGIYQNCKDLIKMLDHSKILNRRFRLVRKKLRHINEHKLDRHVPGCYCFKRHTLCNPYKNKLNLQH